MAGELRVVGEAVEDGVVLPFADLVVEAVEQAAVEERHAGGEGEPVAGVAEVGLVAPEVGDAEIGIEALSFFFSRKARWSAGMLSVPKKRF